MNNIPLSEYPRPQFERDSYLCLNGLWNYSVYEDKNLKDSFNENEAMKKGEILVPYPIESKLSGVEHLLLPNELLVYEREFDLDESFLRDLCFLHFGAVDHECRVFLNNKELGYHKGGYIAFSFDVTKDILVGKNHLKVLVTDQTDSKDLIRGKQKLKPGSIFYTPISGIWQTVWLEAVSKDYVKSIKIDPNIDKKTINLKLESEAKEVEIAIFDKENEIHRQRYNTKDAIGIDINNPKLWSPEKPFIYQMEIRTDKDLVKSYFAMRKFSFKKDKKGYMRLALNNKIYFHNGVLDQGYHQEGIYTAKNDAELKKDIELLKELGFNMARKHVKIEPLRWYYHCDHLGLLVWQDLVCGGKRYSYSKKYRDPAYPLKINDKKESVNKIQDLEFRADFEVSIDETVDLLYNCPSICQWTLFNEGWGQFDSNRLTNDLRAKDLTRAIDSTSGWFMQKYSQSDFFSKHVYHEKIKIPRSWFFKNKVLVISECGGYGRKIENHQFDPEKSFGYKLFDTEDSVTQIYEDLYNTQIIANIDKGVSACVYTQLSDVEIEVNGLVTYDRQVFKLDIDRVKAINAIINNLNTIER
ncbi:MAG: sugar-binding domain-containing protein [Tissierellales bacterium]